MEYVFFLFVILLVLISMCLLQVILECAGMYQPLFVMSGSCHGVDIGLDMESVPFGAVVQNSANARKIVMSNNGDIGAR